MRQFVQGKTVERGPVEPLVSDAAPQPIVLPFPGEPAVHVSAAPGDKASSDDVVPQPAVLAVLREQTEHGRLSAVAQDEGSIKGALPQSASGPLPDEPAPMPAAMEAVHDHVPPAVTLISPAQPVDHSASWWRIPVILSSLAVAVAGTAVAIVKPVRDGSRAQVVVVAPAQPVENDASAAVSTKDTSAAASAKELGAAVSNIPAPANEPGSSEHVVSGDRVRLRGAPGSDAPVLKILRQDTAVRITEHSAQNEWCRVEAAGGYAGWMKCEFLVQRPVAGTDPAPRSGNPESGSRRGRESADLRPIVRLYRQLPKN